MIKQISLYLVVIGIASMYSLGYMKSRAKCVGIITVIMTLFSGLRSWWLGDLIKYYTLYLSCTGAGWKSAVFSKWANIGIRIFFRIAGWLHISYDVCIFLIAAFVAYSLGKLVYHYSVSIYWSYIMYIAMGFYIFTYSGLKQSIAMGLICLAMVALLDEKPLNFYFWTLSAVIFHAPAAVFFPAYLISKKEFDAVYIWILLLTVILFFLFRTQIASVLSEAYYEEETAIGSGKLIGGRAIMILLIIVLGCWLRPVTASDTIYKKMFTIMLLSFLLQCFSVFGNVFTRLTDYYFQFVVLYVPYFLERGDHQLLMNPNRHKLVHYTDNMIYRYISLGITSFSILYYVDYCNTTLWFLNGFKFFWQINAHALYGG